MPSKNSSSEKDPVRKPAKKPLYEQPKTVGQILKKARIEHKLTLRDVEVATKIRGKYLTAIESDDPALTADVYTRGFVQSYGRYLELDGSALAKQFADEHKPAQAATARPRPAKKRRIVINSQVIIAAAIGLAFVVVAGYLAWQFSALAAPPQLTVSQPPKDQEFYGSLLDIKGHATPGADILVNDSPILVDGSGNFTDQLALQNGINAVNVTAKNHLGKTTTVTRNILAHVPAPEVTAAIPTTTFDGVGVAVNVQGKPSNVTVVVDGNTVFKGTMLPGTSRTFKGKNLVRIDTSNAGATNLTVTNSVVAGKSLGAVGSMGEPKNDLEFAKDTNFQ